MSGFERKSGSKLQSIWKHQKKALPLQCFEKKGRLSEGPSEIERTLRERREPNLLLLNLNLKKRKWQVK
jgi:hypothetical protein